MSVIEFCARCDRSTECTPDTRSPLHLWCTRCGCNVYEPEKAAPRPVIVAELEGADRTPLWSETPYDSGFEVVDVSPVVTDDSGKPVRRMSKSELKRARRNRAMKNAQVTS